MNRRLALWSALAVGGILPSVGCQVEYAGMTLPSGKYMHDDVQYFPSSPAFPWANTQAATQRARMRAMGIEPPLAGAPPAQGRLNPIQNQMGRPTDVNPGFGPVPPLPGNVPSIPAPAPGSVTAPNTTDVDQPNPANDVPPPAPNP
jgi:hypothetical protein